MLCFIAVFASLHKLSTYRYHLTQRNGFVFQHAGQFFKHTGNFVAQFYF